MSQRVLGAAVAAAGIFLLLGSADCAAQSSSRSSSGNASAGGGPPLPADPRLWHNSPPLTRESLEGKGVVFYFFDEECPRCAAGWPEVQKASREYDGKPVLFLAVNSGTDPRTLKRYLAQNRVAWPVVADPTREFENAMGVPKLTSQGEVFALRYVSGDGSSGSIKDPDLAAAAQAALKGASWRVDPKEIPRALLSAWKAIELGDYAKAARQVNRAIDSKDEALKAGAERLLEAVTDEIKSVGKEATAAFKEGDTWTAYKHLQSVEDRFGDYEIELVENAAEKSKELAKTDAIKTQVAAGRLLDKAIAKRSPRDLKRIVTKYPSTEAATKASELLATLPQ